VTFGESGNNNLITISVEESQLKVAMFGLISSNRVQSRKVKQMESKFTENLTCNFVNCTYKFIILSAKNQNKDQLFNKRVGNKEMDFLLFTVTQDITTKLSLFLSTHNAL
jgi:hypothetical protein